MSTSTKTIVDLFYDVRSPYAWFGFEVLNRYHRKFPEMVLRLRPVSLVQIGQATGNSTPMNIPAKREYMSKDLLRLAEYFQLPFNFPKDVRHVMFVKGTHSALCLLTVATEMYPEYVESLSRSFFMRIWYKDQDVTKEESLKEVCLEAGVPEDLTATLIKTSQSVEASNSLENCGKEALKHGAFGVPTYVAYFKDGPKTFFGTDRLFLLCYYLNVPFPGALNELKSPKL